MCSLREKPGVQSKPTLPSLAHWYLATNSEEVFFLEVKWWASLQNWG